VAGESLLGESAWGLTGLAPGTLVAGYRVESRVGAGGMAMVFRARDEALGRTVALKILAPALTDDAAFRERFIRESRAAAVVDHPHIIPVYGAGEFGGVLYIAMRFVAGGDLRALLQREGPLPASRAAFLLSPLASALDAGHAAGLVHRDVKPANVLIDTSPGRPDHLYLSDFGLARGTASTGLTGTGQFLGTVEYCAPEQIGGKPARPQTDQYALGCVAYTMFTGTVPFPRDEVTAALWAHMSEPPPLVTALRPDLPPAVNPVLARAMAKDPEDRYSTCTDFADAVRAALGISAYTTPSSVYSIARTGLPRASDDRLTDPASTVLPVPVPPSPLSTPPSAPAWASVPQEAAVADSPALAHAPTQSRYSAGYAATEWKAITQPGSSPAPETSPHGAVNPTRPRGRHRGMLAAAVVVVVAGGATTAALVLSSHGSPPAPVASHPPGPLATLADPTGATPTGVAFKSDGTLITVDAIGGAYSWDITTSRPTQTDLDAAATLTSEASQVVGVLKVTAGSQDNVVQVRDSATGKVVATLAAPSGTVANAFALSPDGTEVAVADSNGSTYVWKIAS
jgi:serine/threonine protein kinase